MSARLVGLQELMRKLDQPTWVEGPVRDLMDSWRFFTEREAKGNAPVWRGQLRRSLTSERDSAQLPRWARAGTNIFYGEWVHEGTDPHFPPIDAVAPWARSHGIEPYLVARAISLYGTKPQPYLRDAHEAAERRLPAWVAEAASAIEAAAGAG